MILTIPGLYNSGPEHWQSRWDRELPDCHRVGQREWESPRREDWVANIDAALNHGKPPYYLVGHSLGCIAIAYWAQTSRRHIAGALLVAPADTEQHDFPPDPKGFRPLPTRRLPFPTILVASEDDPWLALSRAESIAKNWASRFVNIGRAGHISGANVGSWAEGKRLLRELMQG
jgi:predicted alpha/beta hydrolase family esterase